MPVEIERKFLVNHELWGKMVKPQGNHYRQGYLVAEPGKTIRVRVTDRCGYITIKGASVGATRSEFEYEIPKEESQELLDLFSVSELSKIRYNIEFEGKLWEVDEFLGDNSGLLMAEIELASEAESFELPRWIEKEVTGDKRYYNSYLSKNPFSKW
jgi:adenylate cyclase